MFISVIIWHFNDLPSNVEAIEKLHWWCINIVVVGPAQQDRCKDYYVRAETLINLYQYNIRQCGIIEM